MENEELIKLSLTPKEFEMVKMSLLHHSNYWFEAIEWKKDKDRAEVIAYEHQTLYMKLMKL